MLIRADRPMSVDPLAAAGFGAGQGHYDLGRPAYSAAVIEVLASELGIGPGRRVLDLGAGNGRLTRALVRTGARLVAAEPVAEMRAAFVANQLGVPILAAVAEVLPVAARSLDVVTVGQAFHWFKTKEALEEVGRVLRPGGGLALVWHERDEDVPWVAALDRATLWNERRPAALGTDWAGAVAMSGLFSPLRHTTLPEELMVDRTVLDAHVRSISYVAAMPEPERESILARVADVVEDLPASFPLSFISQIYWCHRAR